MPAARVLGLIVALGLALLAGCAGPGPAPVELPPPPLTESQRQALESKRYEIRQELLALESLSEIQRALGPHGSLEEAQIGLAERQTDSIARYFRLQAQLQYIEQLLR